LTGNRESAFGRLVPSKVVGPVLVVALVALAALLATSCSSGEADAPQAKAQPQPPRQIHITATDKSYEMPGELESEPVSLTLQNKGGQVHRAYFARLNQGVTEKDVRSALSKSPDALFSMVTLAGSMPEIEPGARSQIGMLFPEGHYLVIDPEVEGPPPVSFFAVSAASGPEVIEPVADYSIAAGDFYFKISDPSPGEATVEIANVGKQSHEVGIGRKRVKGQDAEVATVFAPAPGGKMWIKLTLNPGDYTLLCFLPDPKTGKSHVELGMKQNFTVE
jgi:hypothetical protein